MIVLFDVDNALIELSCDNRYEWISFTFKSGKLINFFQGT